MMDVDEAIEHVRHPGTPEVHDQAARRLAAEVESLRAAVARFEVLRPLATVSPNDEWHAADLYDELASAVLRALDGDT